MSLWEWAEWLKFMKKTVCGIISNMSLCSRRQWYFPKTLIRWLPDRKWTLSRALTGVWMIRRKLPSMSMTPQRRSPIWRRGRCLPQSLQDSCTMIISRRRYLAACLTMRTMPWYPKDWRTTGGGVLWHLMWTERIPIPLPMPFFVSSYRPLMNPASALPTMTGYRKSGKTRREKNIGETRMIWRRFVMKWRTPLCSETFGFTCRVFGSWVRMIICATWR